MRLSDRPTSRRRGRVSSVDRLPTDILDQLLEARRSGSHSVNDMVDWLHSDPDHTDPVFQQVTASALSQWFAARGHRVGSV
jgi:hypothetical protein